MDASIISALIAFVGVIVSVLISFYSSRNLLRTELVKIETAIEQNYATKLVEKRLSDYPFIYEPLSDMGKLILLTMNDVPNQDVTFQHVTEFLEKYNSANSKYGVLFSSSSMRNSYELRKYIIKLIKENGEENKDGFVPKETLKEIGGKIRKLEFSMKQDLGVYLVEFKDPKNKLQLQRYSDANKYAERDEK